MLTFLACIGLAIGLTILGWFFEAALQIVLGLTDDESEWTREVAFFWVLVLLLHDLLQ